MKNLTILVIAFILFLQILPVSSHSAVFNIPPGDVSALIDAIITSNSNGEVDTINLANGSTYTLSPANDGRIPFPADGVNGLPSITSELSINGNGSNIVGSASNIPCDGVGVEFRIFHVSQTGDLILNDISVSNGCASGNNSNGGGIYIDCCFLARLEINNSMLFGNSALLSGGAIHNNKGTLIVNNSTLSGNSAGSHGGAISYVMLTSPQEINDSTISGNSATFGGGVSADFNTVKINKSTISGNTSSSDGGGIFTFRSTIDMTNSTVSGNSSDTQGGGIFIFSRNSFISNSTIYGNSAGTEGSGIFSNGNLELSNTIIANNLFGTDCDGDFGVIFSNGYNIDSDGTCDLIEEGDKPFTDPLLDTLAANGGPTNTHALLEGSPAIDMGDPSGCLDPQGLLINEDQRGFPRPNGVACDIGAYEIQDSEPPPLPTDEAQMAIREMIEDLMKVLSDNAPAPTVTTPILLTPINNDIIQQNNPNIGCPFDQTRGFGFRLFFDWTDATSPNGIRGYHLFAMRIGAIFPIIDTFVQDSNFTELSCNSFVIDSNLNDWIWTVQAEDNLGNLSSVATDVFMFEPCRLADGTPCDAPP